MAEVADIVDHLSLDTDEGAWCLGHFCDMDPDFLKHCGPHLDLERLAKLIGLGVDSQFFWTSSNVLAIDRHIDVDALATAVQNMEGDVQEQLRGYLSEYVRPENVGDLNPRNDPTTRERLADLPEGNENFVENFIFKGVIPVGCQPRVNIIF